MEAITELMHLSEDFVYASRAVGKLIISEVSLPFEEKVIQPITKGLGGRAGGEKYIVHNILFKFSLDCFGLFGGSDLAAAKGFFWFICCCFFLYDWTLLFLFSFFLIIHFF